MGATKQRVTEILEYIQDAMGELGSMGLVVEVESAPSITGGSQVIYVRDAETTARKLGLEEAVRITYRPAPDCEFTAEDRTAFADPEDPDLTELVSRVEDTVDVHGKFGTSYGMIAVFGSWLDGYEPCRDEPEHAQALAWIRDQLNNHAELLENISEEETS